MMILTENLNTLLSCILILTALASVLSLGVKDLRESIAVIVTLIIGIGFLSASSKTVSSAFLIAALLVFLVLILLYKNSASSKNFWWGVAVFSLSIVAAVLYVLTGNVTLLFFSFMVMMPLFPLHGGYVSILSGLPLSLSAFLSLLLPLMGLYGIFSMSISEVFVVNKDSSAATSNLLVVFATAGALYGSLKAVIQKKTPEFAAYAGLALYSILWLGLALNVLGSTSMFVYAVSIGMVTAGVLLIWRVVTVRYGDVRLDTLITRIGGLSKPMPIFGVLVFFIAWAAVGLPPFGLFAGFIEVLMGMSAKLSWHTFVVLFTWLMASWYFIMFLQKVLFGPKKLSFEYKRLKYNEGISLVIVLIILLMLGVGIIKMPSDGVVLTGNDKNTKTEVISWVK